MLHVKVLCTLLPFCYTYMYPQEVYNAMYGSLGFEELFIPESTDDLTPDDIKNISTLDVRDVLRKSLMSEDYHAVDLEINNITVDGVDAKDFNDISAKLANLTRRAHWAIFWGMTDWDDWGWTDLLVGWDLENKKKKQFEKICLMFLYHARYRIEKAFLQRQSYRTDKRYKLGYLFNRLRRLKTEMLKFVAVGKAKHESDGRKHQNLTTLMRIYERVVHIDVDIRDTTALITEVFSKKMPYDILGGHTNAKGDHAVTPEMAGGGQGGAIQGESGERGDTNMDDLQGLLKEPGAKDTLK